MKKKLSDEYTESQGKMKEISARIRAAHLQAPEELPEGAGVDEDDESPEVEEQEPEGNTHVNDVEDIAEPPEPQKKTDAELNTPIETYLSDDEEEELKADLKADQRSGEMDPGAEKEKSLSATISERIRAAHLKCDHKNKK